LQIHCDPNASVYCDPGLLQQVILNLAKNGFESMDSEHLSEKVLKISVRNNSNPKQIEIVFDDTGTGISSENSAQLFRPFFSTKPDGLGIGLGFSLSIAEHNGGSISWTNKPSGGAQFTLTLPITRNEIERRHAASHVAK
jgi:two-component system sensor histidine kinase DctS